MKVKYTESPCNDDNLHVTISSNYIISKSLSYIIVICHQRFSVEYITKYVCRKKEKLCYYEINENLDICVGLCRAYQFTKNFHIYMRVYI